MCPSTRYGFPTPSRRCCVTLQPLVHSVGYVGAPYAKFGDQIHFSKATLRGELIRIFRWNVRILIITLKKENTLVKEYLNMYILFRRNLDRIKLTLNLIEIFVYQQLCISYVRNIYIYISIVQFQSFSILLH